MNTPRESQDRPAPVTGPLPRRTPEPAEATTVPLLRRDKAVNTIPGWPTAPKRIRKPLYLVIWNSVFDLILFACACAFLAFAAIVGYYDQAPTAEHQLAKERLQNAIKYGPTVFPILFALILGRATQAVLLWRLERGERVGILDLLASSTSLTSTVVSQFQLRVVSLLGLALVFVWALSPVGGQASIRQMGIGTRIQSQPATFDYMVHNGYGYAFSSAYSIQFVGFLNSVFNGAIVAPGAIQSTPRDLWGNVKIPRIEHYEHVATADNDGWYDTQHGDASTYTSFIGIPISGLNSSQFIDYKTRIHTSCLNVRCSLDTSRNLLNFTAKTPPDPSNPDRFQNFTGNGGTIFTEHTRAHDKEDDLDIFAFIFATYFLNWDYDYTLYCNISATYVESEIVCPEASSCAVNKARRSRLAHFPSNWTFIDAAVQNLGVLFGEFLRSSSATLRGATLVQRYLSDPDVIVREETLYLVNRTTEENYSVRMGQLLNSYFNIMNGLYAITGGINENTAYFYDRNLSFVPSMVPGRNSSRTYFNFTGEQRRAKAWTAEGTKSTSTEIIVAYKPWVVILCIASIVLIFASLISPIVHHFLIKGPEIMMNISSLAMRDNPNVPLPESGTYLGASDRARLLQGVRIRYGDTEGNSNVGRLVMGSLDAKISNIEEIQQARLYE